MTEPTRARTHLTRHAQTEAVRGGLTRSQFHETSEALYLTSGYVYPSAAEAEAAFAGKSDHMGLFAVHEPDSSGGGTLITFAVEGGKDDAFAVVDALELFDISNNLGDAKSLVTHPATTTHQRIGPERRAEMGLGDEIIRLSIGLEDARDLIADLQRGLG